MYRSIYLSVVLRWKSFDYKRSWNDFEEDLWQTTKSADHFDVGGIDFCSDHK